MLLVTNRRTKGETTMNTRFFQAGPFVGIHIVPGSFLMEAVMWVQGFHEVFQNGDRSFNVFTETTANRAAQESGHVAVFSNQEQD